MAGALLELHLLSFSIKPAAVKDAVRTGGHSAASVASCPEAQGMNECKGVLPLWQNKPFTWAICCVNECKTGFSPTKTSSQNWLTPNHPSRPPKTQ